MAPGLVRFVKFGRNAVEKRVDPALVEGRDGWHGARLVLDGPLDGVAVPDIGVTYDSVTNPHLDGIFMASRSGRHDRVVTYRYPSGVSSLGVKVTVSGR